MKGGRDDEQLLLFLAEITGCLPQPISLSVLLNFVAKLVISDKYQR